MKRKLTIISSSLLILSLLTILSLTICHKLSDYFITYQLKKDLKNSNYVYTPYNTDTNNTVPQQDLSHIQLNNPKTQTIIQNNKSDTVKIKKYIKLGIDNKNKINNTLKDNTIKNFNSESIIISNTLLEIARLSAEYSNLLRIYNLADAKQYYYENKDKLRISMVFVEEGDEGGSNKGKDKKDKDKIGNGVIVIGENTIQPLSRKVVNLDDENGNEDKNGNGEEDEDKPKVKLVTYEFDLNMIRDNKVFKFIIVEDEKKSIFDVNLSKLKFNEY